MKNQDYKSHRRWVLSYHGFTFLVILAILIGSIRNLWVSQEENAYPAVLLLLTGIALLFVSYFARSFALKAQDRAIRAEERLRYYVLTGEMLSPRLTTRQLIGLRFASDAEYAELAKQAEAEGLSEEAIKKRIKVWKPDTYRV